MAHAQGAANIASEESHVPHEHHTWCELFAVLAMAGMRKAHAANGVKGRACARTPPSGIRAPRELGNVFVAVGVRCGAVIVYVGACIVE